MTSSSAEQDGSERSATARQHIRDGQGHLRDPDPHPGAERERLADQEQRVRTAGRKSEPRGWRGVRQHRPGRCVLEDRLLAGDTPTNTSGRRCFTSVVRSLIMAEPGGSGEPICGRANGGTNRTMAANEHVRRSGALTRVAVLDAAERLFAARGYRGTSLEEIGREAGLSRGTPGYFFGSKQRLYGEVLDRILTRAQTTLADCDRRTPGTRACPCLKLLEELVTAHLGVLSNRSDARAADPMGDTRGPRSDPRPIECAGKRLRRADPEPRRDRAGSATLDDTTATELLICATAMCWFPLAHADALERTFHRDPHSPEAIAAQAKTIVEFLLRRFETLRSTPPG